MLALAQDGAFEGYCASCGYSWKPSPADQKLFRYVIVLVTVSLLQIELQVLVVGDFEADFEVRLQMPTLYHLAACARISKCPRTGLPAQNAKPTWYLGASICNTTGGVTPTAEGPAMPDSIPVIDSGVCRMLGEQSSALLELRCRGCGGRIVPVRQPLA